jgi:PAS domain S-box-containing protein
LQTALDAVLSASIEILNADMGNIQLFQQTKKGLKIVAQQGFQPEFLATFDFVDATDNSACGRALRSGQRCIIEDVLADESYAPYRDAARSAGYRAVQSTPLISHNGAMLGILSTHFRQPHSLRDREQKLLDLLGQQAADLIDRLTAEEKLKELNETLEASVIQQTRQVHESEEQFRVLVNASAQIIWTTDAQGEVVADSPSWRSFTGQTFEEWIGWGWTAVLHPEDRTHAAQAWQHAVETETQLNIEYRIYHAESGDYRWTHVRAEQLRAPTGQVRGWVGMNIDIHERKRAEAQLRQLASRLTMAEQEERRRISQILHDDLQQLLYGIQVKLALMRTNGEEAQWTQLAKHQEQAEAWIAAAIMTTRRLTVDLSPPMLQGEGLVNTLNWLVTQMADLHSLAVSVEADHVFQIENEDMRVLLFQIIRELLFNVAKHAETNRAVVILGEADGQLIIRVNDDGRGFDPTLAYNQTKNSFGLFSIRERLGLFGGRLEIVSNRDEGTRITIYVPQPPKPDPASDD